MSKKKWVIAMNVNFGSRIRLHRVMKGWTRAEFAKMINVSEQAVGLYERSERQPTYEMLKDIADFFGVTTDYILGHTPSTDSQKLLSMIDLSDSEILAKCKLVLDGKILSEEESKWFISMIRTHRTLTDSSQ